MRSLIIGPLAAVLSVLFSSLPASLVAAVPSDDFIVGNASSAYLGTREDDGLKFLVVGDSVTQGHQGDFTWRYQLWRWFAYNSVPVRFVGPYAETSKPLPAAPPSPTLFQGEKAPTTLSVDGAYSKEIPSDSNFFKNTGHFAVWGRQLGQDVPLIGEVVSTHQPDWVLVELGFNDIGWFASDAAGTINNMKKFIDNVRAVKKDAKFVIANIPRRFGDRERRSCLLKLSYSQEFLISPGSLFNNQGKMTC
ncbi:SGNH hydrolase-type esterase domain-containing protein [Xylariales sp. AK1849]|nr:SGNH hydrolase-type esterase domain-containing protein [Xylariales sp. AK1849]